MSARHLPRMRHRRSCPVLARPTSRTPDDRCIVSPVIDTSSSSRGRIGTLTNAIVSGSATLIAIVALVVGMYQAKLSRDQANASVWPYLLQGNSDNNGYSRVIQNVGIGPARVRAFEIRVDGKIVHTWREVADSLHVALSWRGHRTTTMRAGVVIPPATLTEVLELPDTNDAKLFRVALASHKIQTWICYCSIYDRCWAGGGTDDEPKDVKSCREDPARAFHD